MKNGDVIVIGAGSVGANVAYRLAARGARVTVLEAGAPGGGTSGVSFAWTNSFNKTPRDYHDLNTAGMAEHRALRAGARGRRLAPARGRHRLGRGAGRAGAAQGNGRAARRAGAIPSSSSPRTRRGLSSRICTSRRTWTRWSSRRARATWRSCRSSARSSPTLGASAPGCCSGQRVTGVLREGARVRGVTTASGSRLEADAVVDCAGPATDEVARLAGIEIPFDRVPGRLIYTTPVASTLRRPIHAPGVHFRPDSAGRIVLAEGAHDHVWREAAPGGEAWPAEQSLARRVRPLPRAGRRPRRSNAHRRAADAERRAADGRRHPRARRVLRRRVSQRGDARAAVGPDRRGGAPRRRRRPAPGPLRPARFLR